MRTKPENQVDGDFQIPIMRLSIELARKIPGKTSGYCEKQWMLSPTLRRMPKPLALGRLAGEARGMLTVYCYQKCSTCRDALKWLADRGIAHQVKAIRETPPTTEELATALEAMGGDLRRLFNTSGIDYRALGLKNQLPTMTQTEAFGLLATNGNLVKRPFLVGGGQVLVGFKPEVWARTLA